MAKGDLNNKQLLAVEYGEGPLLVLAGAGSGKTRVLTHRIAHLLETGRAKPSEILSITFTNKAAKEMRARVSGLVGGVSRRMWVMTFHSACTRILRSEAERLGYTSRFTIYDDADSVRLIKRCMEELEIDPKRFSPKAVRTLISEAKAQLVDAKAYSDGVSGQFDQTAADIYEVYERQLHKMNAMDFDDLLMRAANLFETHAEVLERYQDAFRWILVDEYQDTNHAQYRLLKMLADKYRNLCVVGDDDQSIYRFRGADIRNILDFEKDFPDAEVIKLEQNYRSTQNILSAANAVVSNNLGRKEKSLWTSSGAGEPIHIVELEDEHSEAGFVVSEIGRLCEEQGTSLSEIAVFYRINAQSRVLEDALVRGGHAYQVIGGTKFYERAEIKDALAYLTLLANPDDQIAFRRIINSPKRGIGDTTVARLAGHANTVGTSMWDLVLKPDEIPGLGTAAVKALRGFSNSLEPLKDLVGKTTVPDLLERVLDVSGYIESLKLQRTIEAQGRAENLQELVGVAMEYQETEDSPSLEEFLQQVALHSDQDELDEAGGQITLMTLHNAKGLEFPVVFVIGCEEGIFPHSRSVDEGNIEEERRLCYVGMTRSKERLFMSYAKRRVLFGDHKYNLRSRFLDEVPFEFVEQEDEQGARAGTGWDPTAAASTDSNALLADHVAAETYRPGEDVYHEAFGEGVVIDSEPGGVLLVRFSEDGAERKLVADIAPLARR